VSKAAKHKSENKERSKIHDEIKGKEKAFVLFYVTWCPFSKRFLPTFEEYAKRNPQQCLSVIADDKPDVCEEYSTEYYPTVILFKKRKSAKTLGRGARNWPKEEAT
jgi:thiol-disulfide isomerase/thioredoxin